MDPHIAAFADLAKTVPAGVGDLVRNVPDATGLGADASAPTDAARPLLTEDDNGWRRLSLDGISSVMLSEFTLNNPFSVLVVGQAEATKFLIDGAEGVNNRASLYCPDDSHIRWYSGSAGVTLPSEIGTLQTYLGVADGQTKIARVAGVENSIFVGTIQNPGGLTIGASGNLVSNWFTTGTIYRVLAYNRALDADERESLTEYTESLYASPPRMVSGSTRLATRSQTRMSLRI